MLQALIVSGPARPGAGSLTVQRLPNNAIHVMSQQEASRRRFRLSVGAHRRIWFIVVAVKDRGPSPELTC
jgi:hypothetical protein